MYPCNLQSKPEKESEMYPQCRHVRTDSNRCHAAAIKGGHWCFFHARLHDQQAQRVAREAQRRSRDASSQHRLTDGTFAPAEEAPEGIPESIPEGIPESIIDQGYPVSRAETGCHPERSEGPAFSPHFPETLPLQLPDVEDSASIQLALIEVIHALAANQLDPRRAGLLLYALQVASANAKNVHVSANCIRSISYTKEGIPLATQEHGWDVEDIEEADREAEEEPAE
jgi:hypothetical protein